MHRNVQRQQTSGICLEGVTFLVARQLGSACGTRALTCTLDSPRKKLVFALFKSALISTNTHSLFYARQTMLLTIILFAWPVACNYMSIGRLKLL